MKKEALLYSERGTSCLRDYCIALLFFIFAIKARWEERNFRFQQSLSLIIYKIAGMRFISIVLCTVSMVDFATVDAFLEGNGRNAICRRLLCNKVNAHIASFV